MEPSLLRTDTQPTPQFIAESPIKAFELMRLEYRIHGRTRCSVVGRNIFSKVVSEPYQYTIRKGPFVPL